MEDTVRLISGLSRALIEFPIQQAAILIRTLANPANLGQVTDTGLSRRQSTHTPRIESTGWGPVVPDGSD